MASEASVYSKVQVVTISSLFYTQKFTVRGNGGTTDLILTIRTRKRADCSIYIHVRMCRLRAL